MEREIMTKEEYIKESEDRLSSQVKDILDSIDVVERLVQKGYDDAGLLGSDGKLQRLKNIIEKEDFYNYDIYDISFDLEDISRDYENHREFEIADYLGNVYTLARAIPDSKKRLDNIDEEYEKYVQRMKRING